MKKEKNQVAKLEKKAKDDNRDANGNTNELKLNNTIKNENEETSKKKKGRPKKSSNDLFETIYPKLSLKLSDEEIEKLKGKDRIIAKIVSKSENPQLAELKRISKTIKKATLEDIGSYMGKHLEMSYPILEQIIEKEYFEELMQSPNAKEILSSKNVKTILSEMIKEYTDFTMDFLNQISDNKTSLSELNTNGEVLNRISQLKEKYSRKLVVEVEVFNSSKEPKKKFNRTVTENLTDEVFRKLSEEALEKINEVDCSEMKTKSRWRPEFLAQVKPIEIPQKEEQHIEEEKERFPNSELKEAPINSMKEPHLEWIEIRLKNLTDEKLKDVLVFDHHDEFKGRVEYSSSVFSYGIKEFLRQLSAIQKGKYAIRFFRYIASCDLQRFADKQANAYITASFTNLSGTSYSIPYRPDHLKDNDNRAHKSIADVTPTNGVNFYSNLSLSLEYLMPETTLTIYLVVEKTDK